MLKAPFQWTVSAKPAEVFAYEAPPYQIGKKRLFLLSEFTVITPKKTLSDQRTAPTSFLSPSNSATVLQQQRASPEKRVKILGPK